MICKATEELALYRDRLAQRIRESGAWDGDHVSPESGGPCELCHACPLSGREVDGGGWVQSFAVPCPGPEEWPLEVLWKAASSVSENGVFTVVADGDSADVWLSCGNALPGIGDGHGGPWRNPVRALRAALEEAILGGGE